MEKVVQPHVLTDSDACGGQRSSCLRSIHMIMLMCEVHQALEEFTRIPDFFNECGVWRHIHISKVARNVFKIANLFIFLRISSVTLLEQSFIEIIKPSKFRHKNWAEFGLPFLAHLYLPPPWNCACGRPCGWESLKKRRMIGGRYFYRINSIQIG